MHLTPKFRIFQISSLLLSLVFSLAVPARAADEKPLSVAIREFLPPYVYEQAKSGIEVDLVKAVMDTAHIPYHFLQLPRVRMIQSFEDGKIDALLTQNAGASSVGCTTVPYIIHHNYAFTLADRKLKITSMADLSHFAVISFSGATRYLGPDFAVAVSHSPRYTESGDQGTHIALLYKKRFDVVVGDQWIIRLAQRRYLEKSGQYMDMEPHAIMPPSHYVARFHDQKYCNAFDTAYAKLTQDGTLADIWNGYKASILVDAGPRH